MILLIPKNAPKGVLLAYRIYKRSIVLCEQARTQIPDSTDKDDEDKQSNADIF